MNLNRVGCQLRDLREIDRPIKLPDDVLLNIVERMSTLDAIRTCIISKETLKLLTMLSQIIIVIGTTELLRINGVVADVTSMILRTRAPQIPIRNLKLKFILRGDDHLKIGRSVALAMVTQEIDVAEFEILTNKGSYDCTRADLLFFATQFKAFIGECPDAFGGLTRLHLQNLRFGESDIPNILITCKRLESLHFFLCDAGPRSVLSVEHARLIELDITHGYFSTVELKYLPKLQRMSYNNWHYAKNPLVLGFVPQLSELGLANAYVNTDRTIRISQLLINGSLIRSMYLDFRSGKIWVQPECQKLLAPVLGNLRLVNLDNLPEECDIAWTLFFLEAAPSLEELCIIVWDHKCHIDSRQSYSKKTDLKWEPSTADFKHKNLAKLTIHGFESNDSFTRYVTHVMKAAVNIRVVSLHDKKVCKHCTGKFSHVKVRPSSYPQTDEEKDLLSRKITGSLVATSHAVIQFRPSCYYSPPVMEIL
ncbi:hypothetical protein CFC21_093867 [Triticum aestivum]|uniref:F-box domain-containing protein n=2 Tax=Triticum aestivum TaxID=4565 RepID=A0A9R1LLV9_WHEAT|nr:uncharacterized protein LOC123141864 [Triticum aestivum]KAF7091253.1 hypothetical protein CFC21_093867 [Triticum aestivum]